MLSSAKSADARDDRGGERGAERRDRQEPGDLGERERPGRRLDDHELVRRPRRPGAASSRRGSLVAGWWAMATRLLPRSGRVCAPLRSARAGRNLKRGRRSDPPAPRAPVRLAWPPENLEGLAAPAQEVSPLGQVVRRHRGAWRSSSASPAPFIRVPYDTLRPGGTLDLEHRVSVKGVKTESDRGEVMLLFVRLRAHVDLWSWLQAKLDPDIDLVKQVNVTGGHTQQVQRSPRRVRHVAVADLRPCRGAHRARLPRAGRTGPRRRRPPGDL